MRGVRICVRNEWGMVVAQASRCSGKETHSAAGKTHLCGPFPQLPHEPDELRDLALDRWLNVRRSTIADPLNHG